MHKNKMNFSVIIISIVLLFLVGTCIASWVITISKSFKPEYNQSGEIISSIDASSVVYDGNYHMPIILNEEIINDSKYVIKYATSNNPNFFLNIQIDNEGLLSSGPMNAGTYSFKYENVNNKNDYVIVPFEIVKADVEIVNVPTSLSTIYGKQISIESSDTYAVHKTIPTLKVTGTFVLTDTLLEASGTADSITKKTSIEFIPTGDDANNYNTAIINDVTVSLDPVAYSGSTYYSSVEYATKMVTSTGSTIFVIPGKNPTVYKDFSVSSGVTLSLPYENELIGGIDDKDLLLNNNGKESYARNNEATYKKSEVIFSQGVILTINGTLTIGGVMTGGGGTQTAGHTVGNYAQIVLEEESKIICNGVINCHGYIIGTYGDYESAVTINNGAQISMPFVVQEHRGGTIFKSMAHLTGLLDFNPKLKTAPFNRFHFNNIESLLIFEYGSKLIGLADLYASSSHNTTKINVIGPDSNTAYMISMVSGSRITSRYHHSTQITDLDIQGSANLKPLEISVMGMTLSTKSVYLPISWYYRVTLDKFPNGNDSMFNLEGQKLKILPGSIFKINQGVTVTADEITIFDSIPEDVSGCPPYPTKYPTGELANETIPEAEFVLNGKLVLNKIGGKVLTSVENAILDVKTSGVIKTQEFIDVGPIYAVQTQSLKIHLFTFSGVSDKPTIVAEGYYESMRDSNNKYGWLTDEISLSYDLNIGTGSVKYKDNISISTSGHILSNDELPGNYVDINLNTYRENYEFVCWSFDPNFDPYSEPELLEGTRLYANTVFYAIWKPIDYDIIYDYQNFYNGSEYSVDDKIYLDLLDVDTYPNKYNVEGTYKLPQNPICSGYQFSGWYKDADFTQRITSLTPGMFTGPGLSSGIKIYALWTSDKVKTYRIDFEVEKVNGDIVSGDYIGLVSLTESCFNEDGILVANFSMYSDILENLNNNSKMEYFYSNFIVNGESITGSEVTISESNTINGTLTIRVKELSKLKIIYDNDKDFFYAIPNNSSVVLPEETSVAVTFKNPLTLEKGYKMIWFTSSSKNNSTFFIGGKEYIEGLNSTISNFDATNNTLTVYGEEYYQLTLTSSDFTTNSSGKLVYAGSATNLLFYELDFKDFFTTASITVKAGSSIFGFASGSATVTETQNSTFKECVINKIIIKDCVNSGVQFGITVTDGKTWGSISKKSYSKRIYCGLFDSVSGLKQVIFADDAAKTIVGIYAFSNCSFSAGIFFGKTSGTLTNGSNAASESSATAPTNTSTINITAAP